MGERAVDSVGHTLYVLRVFCLFLILVISHFCFDGKILVLIVRTPGHCIYLLHHTVVIHLFQAPVLYKSKSFFKSDNRQNKLFFEKSLPNWMNLVSLIVIVWKLSQSVGYYKLIEVTLVIRI